jgi:hypothetical protein
MRHLESLGPPDNLEQYDEWDDSLDGEGDPDPTWDVEHETESNESSVTLSSQASSKRAYDKVETESEHDDDGVSSPYPPGSWFVVSNSITISRIVTEPKRLRVQ